MCCLTGGWWGIIVILLNKRSPHMKKKKNSDPFTLTASFFLTAHQRQCQHNQHNTATFNGPGFSPSSHREKSTPQTGTASVLKLAILAGKFSIQTTISSTPAPSPESHCRPAPRTRWAASQFHVAAPVKRPHSSPAPHTASAGMLTTINPRADDGHTDV